MNKESAKKFLFEVYDVLESINLKPFLIGGTLLGAVRDKDFIEWDKDIDLGLVTDYFNNQDSFYELSKKLQKIGARVETVWHDFMFRIVGDCPYHIDVAIHKKFDNEYRLEVFGNFARYIKISLEALDTYDDIIFLNKNVRTPGNTGEYFKCLYGDDWKIPSEKFTIPIIKTRSYGKVRYTYIRPILDNNDL